MNAPIGVIDSGVGGLTVVKEMLRLLPNESIYYIGDTARCPYGPRSQEQVRTFTWQMADALSKMNIKMLVIACNTATAVALESLQKKCPFPVIGVINAGARAAIKATKSHDIVVLGTEGTVKSGAYDEALYSLSSSSRVTSLACPSFVPLVESGEYEGEFADQLVKESLQPLHQTSFDTVILGCTHYPLIQRNIEQTVGEHVHVVSSAEETAKDVQDLLSYHHIARMEQLAPEHRFFTTGSVPMFRLIASKWLPLQKIQVKRITLTK
ncbi:glutamate racemase [Viridibacillus sp. FSL R5-0477]|uniref:Glutamate racemase n=1 Tax=Viridibacillus arenosi FSL R5-213 TaxID=1227360 RepID=W4EPN2_9BACL|nr:MULTISPECIES: glutamate racemase [Viridibacillus]ETT82530.1 glutamate racemase [Viridibacillus arenosi FSL R5-213]OMC85499.1 glutamate racemase [Viridibacillus sp. FSL H8-0123]OMC87226.1 glutamate racemase [Viridibacillus sp. FSL H7-0596]OMC92386.1 glutamate racemase [Viridibacillus arenosi]